MSIGAVEDGDNPESMILFWKAAPEPVSKTDNTERGRARRMLRALQIRIQRQNPALSLADAKAEAARQRPDLVALLVAKVLKGQGTRLEELEATTAMLLRQINEDDERETTMTKTDAKAEVNALAEAMVAAGEADTIAEARAAVWRENPDLVKKSRQETSTTVKASDKPTLGEEIGEVVHARALELSATPGLWNERIPDLRVRVWKSPDGERLRALMRAAVSRKPATIKKSGEHAEAFRILANWQKDPRIGLR